MGFLGEWCSTATKKLFCRFSNKIESSAILRLKLEVDFFEKWDKTATKTLFYQLSNKDDNAAPSK